MNSISKEGMDKITIWKNQYIVNGYCSGNLLLKIIIQESYLNTNVMTANIRKKLSTLDTYKLTTGSDITKFNIHVSLLIESLAARGKSTQDLLPQQTRPSSSTSGESSNTTKKVRLSPPRH
jgi:hypothetical protein